MTPFNLDDADAYRLWRAGKLGNYPRRAEDIMVPMDDREAIWRDDTMTAKARAFLTDLLNGDEPLTIRHRLVAGQGLISNNVLYDRSGFEDHNAPNRRRLLYRARFLDRIDAWKIDAWKIDAWKEVEAACPTISFC